MTTYFTPEQVLFVHSCLIQETGGTHGVRDLSMLLSTLGRPQAIFNDQELYPGLPHKAAALMDSLVRNHSFLNGNKRTAITSAGLFLQLNGYRLAAENNDEMVRFTLACAQARLPLEEIIVWFREHSIPYS